MKRKEKKSSQGRVCTIPDQCNNNGSQERARGKLLQSPPFGKIIDVFYN